MSILKKVLSVLLTAALAVLHSSLGVASLSVNEEAEAIALINWKASLQNETQSHLPSWTFHPNNDTNSSSNQNKSSIPCSWYGISCNQAGIVIRLNLTNSGLKGTLHEFSFSSLPNLTLLISAWMNSLVQFLLKLATYPNLYILIYPSITYRGEIPPQIGLLTNLEVLHLVENQLNGSIPWEIGQLESLIELFCMPTASMAAFLLH